VDVLDPVHPVVLLQCHRIESAYLTKLGKRGLEAGESLRRGVGSDELVMLE
jgi:hypothetical protein